MLKTFADVVTSQPPITDIVRDQNGDWYLVPVDPAQMMNCEGCE